MALNARRGNAPLVCHDFPETEREQRRQIDQPPEAVYHVRSVEGRLCHREGVPEHVHWGLRVGAPVRHVATGHVGILVGKERDLVAPVDQSPHQQVDDPLDTAVQLWRDGNPGICGDGDVHGKEVPRETWDVSSEVCHSAAG